MQRENRIHRIPRAKKKLQTSMMSHLKLNFQRRWENIRNVDHFVGITPLAFKDLMFF